MIDSEETKVTMWRKQYQFVGSKFTLDKNNKRKSVGATWKGSTMDSCIQSDLFMYDNGFSRLWKC